MTRIPTGLVTGRAYAALTPRCRITGIRGVLNQSSLSKLPIYFLTFCYLHSYTQTSNSFQKAKVTTKKCEAKHMPLSSSRVTEVSFLTVMWPQPGVSHVCLVTSAVCLHTLALNTPQINFLFGIIDRFMEKLQHEYRK